MKRMSLILLFLAIFAYNNSYMGEDKNSVEASSSNNEITNVKKAGNTPPNKNIPETSGSSFLHQCAVAGAMVCASKVWQATMAPALQKINETYFKGKLEFQPQFTSEQEPSTMSAVIVAPIIEELLFTYFPIAVFNAYKRSWGDMYNKSPTLQAVANLIPVGSSILFGLAHTLVPGYNFPTKLLLFLATTPNNFMRIQYLKRYPENAAVPLLNHMLNNAVSVILTKIYSKK